MKINIGNSKKDNILMEIARDVTVVDITSERSLRGLKSPCSLIVICKPGAYIDLAECQIEGFLSVMCKHGSKFKVAVSVNAPDIFEYVDDGDLMCGITLNITNGSIGE